MSRFVAIHLGLLLGGLLFAPSSEAQVLTDSTATVLAVNSAPDSSSLPTPSGALWRSLAIPGWGQVYVGQPVKVPFVVGALGGLVGLSIYLNGRYSRYQNAYLYVVNETKPDPSTPNPDNPFAEFFQDWIDSGAQAASTTRQLRDDGRRNRDLAILGSGLVYALQALDAYVAAHLVDFDVSEDLSFHVIPTMEGPHLLVAIQL